VVVNLPNNQTYRKAVDGGVHDDSIRTDEEKSPKGYTFALYQNSIIHGRYFIQVGKQRVVEATSEPSILALCIHPSLVDKLGIDGDTENLTVELVQSLCCIREREDFGWADKGEIERIEKENDPLLPKIG
jgi:hypothetical protein